MIRDEPTQRLSAAYQHLHDLQCAIDAEAAAGPLEPLRCSNCGGAVFACIAPRISTMCTACRNMVASAIIAEIEAAPAAPIPPPPAAARPRRRLPGNLTVADVVIGALLAITSIVLVFKLLSLRGTL